jgi:hypothetical protein
MIAPAAYVLRVPEGRREILLGSGHYLPEEYAAHWQEFWTAGESVAEPVPAFEHSRRAPLLVFACFDEGAITHVGDGRKGSSAGTGLVRLNMRLLQPLARPITFDELVGGAPARVRTPLRRALDGGGILPPKSLGAVIDTMLRLEPSLTNRLERFSERRTERLARLTPRGRTNLALQKETLSLALKVSGIDTEEVLTWSPPDGTPTFFLEGLSKATSRRGTLIWRPGNGRGSAQKPTGGPNSPRKPCSP